MRRRYLKPPAWGILGALLLLGTGCGEDGITPACPDASLYDVRDEAARKRPEVVEQLAQAAAVGCATPSGTAVQSSPQQNQAGAPSK